MLDYVQLIRYLIFFSLSINLSNGVPSTLSITSQTSTDRFRRQSHYNANCQIPDNPPNGEYSIGGDDARAHKTGDYVPEYRALLLNCTKGYKSSPPEQLSSICLHGLWQPEPSFCSRTCRPLKSSKSTQIKCFFDNKPLSTCDNPIEGTVAEFSCEALYEDPSIELNPTRSCQDGDWNGIPRCFPICGQKHPIGRPNVVNGATAAIGDYPWHAGIYTNRKEFKCGGAVISPRVILSAAHCFTYLSDGTPYPKENFLVAVGKHYRNYEDTRDDEYSQYPIIDSIRIPLQYRGSKLQYEADIAVIILATSLTLSEAVQPVCVDWSTLFEHQQLIPDNQGVVTGWGFTRQGSELADELKELNVPFTPFDQCFNNVPKAFQKYLRADKICGGYLNSSTATCQGDSGGALVFPRGTNGRFYIRGIVSTSPATTEGQCDSNQYGLYTLVSKHIQFVHSYYHVSRGPVIIKNSVTTAPSSQLGQDGCIFPQDPSNGFHDTDANIFDREGYGIGDYLPQSSVLFTHCHENYGQNPPTMNFSICNNGTWNPAPKTCSRSCPVSNLTEGKQIKCSLDDSTVVNCGSAIEGTVAQISCLPFYELSTLTQNPSFVCQNGTWGSELPQCVPSCGVKTLKSPYPLEVLGEVVTENYPWQVAIYTHEKHHICGGVIISQKAILSAAHCFTDRDGRVSPKENYLIAVGKNYRTYDDSRDKNAQYSNVEAIYVPSQYKGSKQQHYADIALIVLNRTLILSEFVLPACLDLLSNANHEFTPNNTSVLTAWGYGYSLKSSAPSNELREFQIRNISQDYCVAHVSETFKKLLTHDKKCTSYFVNDTLLCFGDSGSPLLTRNPNNNRYYVDGLFMDSPGLCQSRYMSITVISQHLEFIRDHLRSP